MILNLFLSFSGFKPGEFCRLYSYEKFAPSYYYVTNYQGKKFSSLCENLHVHFTKGEEEAGSCELQRHFLGKCQTLRKKKINQRMSLQK